MGKLAFSASPLGTLLRNALPGSGHPNHPRSPALSGLVRPLINASRTASRLTSGVGRFPWDIEHLLVPQLVLSNFSGQVQSEQVSSVGVRRALRDAVGFCREGDIPVVTKLDRLVRSVRHLGKIVAGLEQRNIGLRILDLGVTFRDTWPILNRAKWRRLVLEPA